MLALSKNCRLGRTVNSLPSSLWRLLNILTKARVKISRGLTRLLLGPVSGSMPRNFIASLQDLSWGADYGGMVLEAHQEAAPTLQSFSFPPEFPPAFRRHHADTGRMFYRLRDVMVSPVSGLIWTDAGFIVGESLGSLNKTLTFGNCLHEPLLPHDRLCQPARPLLVCPQAPYYHWLLEVLPRVLWLARNHPAASILLSDSAPAYVTQALQLWLGAAEFARRMVLARGPVAAQEVLLLSMPSASGFPPASDLAAVRSAFLRRVPQEQPTSPSATRKIYISRRFVPGRHLTAEGQVESLARNMGFEIVHPERLTFREQVHLFADAGTLAGLHGAGFSNMVFAQHPCTILELFVPGSFNDCYARMAVMLNFDYSYAMLTDALVGQPALLEQEVRRLLSFVPRERRGEASLESQ